MAGYELAQVVLRQQVHGEMVFEYRDVRVLADRLDKGPFDLGADDYLVKPFGMMEMVARVKAVLRRAAPCVSRPDALRKLYNI